MDTIAQKTPATLPWNAWSTLAPAVAAREVQARVAALAPALRSAALAWLRPEHELALDLAAKSATDPLHGIPYFLKDLFDLGGTEEKILSSEPSRHFAPFAVKNALVHLIRT